MGHLLDLAITAISLIFLTILLTISGVAIPGLFMAAAAPWLDWLISGGAWGAPGAPQTSWSCRRGRRARRARGRRD